MSDYDTVPRELQAKKEKQDNARAKYNQEIEDTRQVLATPSGSAYIHRLLERCGAYTLS
jgi:hypothetical protein